MSKRGFREFPRGGTRETNNKGLTEKVALRRHFLRKYHADEAKVLDCCQGTGQIWKNLRTEFELKSYLGIDIKDGLSRVTMDSTRFLTLKFRENVIDVDTYGEPWKHWLNLLPNVRQPTTVFLTVAAMCSMQMSIDVRLAVFGKDLQMPQSLFASLWPYAIQSLLWMPTKHGLEVVECLESVNDHATRYLGIHIRPMQKQG